MKLYQIIRELIEERNRVNGIIESLEELAGGKRSASSPGRSRRGRKSMDATARKEVSDRMSRYWANRREEQNEPSKALAAGQG